MTSYPGPYEGIVWLNSLPAWNGKNFSPLELPELIMQALGNPQNSYKTVHIAGTNGKGSVSHYLASILQKEYPDSVIGLMTSPHLQCVTERAKINGENVSFTALSKHLLEIKKVAEGNDVYPTYFVAVTCAIFLLFKSVEVDYAVVEVGLGGRYDSTNLLDKPLMTIITSIGYDHQAQLGTTLKSIAWNKAGIARRDVPMLYHAEMPQEAEAEILKVCRETESPVFRVSNEPLIEPAFPMESYQRRNASIAVKAAKMLSCSDTKILEGVTSCSIIGRLQYFPASPERNLKSSILLDAAHNRDGIAALFKYLNFFIKENDFSSLTVVIGFLARKDWQSAVAEIKVGLENLKIKSKVAILEFNREECVSASDLQAKLSSAISYADANQLLQREANEPGRLLACFGSFGLVEKVLGCLEKGQ